jgi:hypothetical protein
VIESSPVEMFVLVLDPYLRSRTGKPQGARVSIETPTDNLRALEPAKARELASALVTAADRADEIDRVCLPHLATFSDALAQFGAEVG